MRVVIRADASVEIGTGHVMRCLALADALRGLGAEIAFICRDLEGHLCDLIEARGLSVCRLPKVNGAHDWRLDVEQSAAGLSKSWPRVDWLIIDHYQLDARWESRARNFADKLMVIDDLADRQHDCDLLLDQNLCRGMSSRYNGLISPHSRLLLGPSYALLRPEFQQARARLRRRDGVLRNILVFFGGSDPINETAKALEGVSQLDRPEIAVDVVVGATNPHREEIRRWCETLPSAIYHCQADNMAVLMAGADLAIGGGGVTTWERCCLGLPSLVAILADNQAELTQATSEYGAIVNLGRADGITAEDYRHAIEVLTPTKLLHMERAALELVDGAGCERVAETLVKS